MVIRTNGNNRMPGGHEENGLEKGVVRSGGFDNYEHVQNRICDMLKHNPRGMTVSEMAKILGMSRNSIGKYTDLLTLAGRVEVRTVGKAKLFYLSHRVPVSELLNFSSDAIIVMEENYNILQVNENARRLFQLPESELVGRNAVSLLQQKAQIKPTPAILYRPLQISASHEIELEQGSQIKSLKVKIIPTVTQSGKPGIIMILEDITNVKKALEALRESEERYRSLIEAAPFGIITVDMEGILTMVNPIGVRMHAYSSPKAMIGLDIRTLISPGDLEKVETISRKVLSGGFVRKEVINLAMKDGSCFPAEISVSSIIGPEKKPAGILIFSIDISEQG
jgi:PAS domain S-box-containing protein